MKKYSEAILEATDQLLERDSRVYVIGLGVPDPKGIFGTTIGLVEKYGCGRIMDMPTSENAMTGIAIGSAIHGMRPIMTHQRVDFCLLALDQIINNASKWHFMFGGQDNVPLVIRLIIGRGWGQGPQHSQTLHSLFAHIPGLKVVMPSTPYDAKGLLISSVEDGNPVIFFEHRWLHGVYGEVPSEIYRVPIGKAKKIREGNDLTLVTCSHMTFEARKAMDLLAEEKISIDWIDLRTIRPLDEEMILESVRKTGRLIVADPDWKFLGLSSEIVALSVEKAYPYLKCAPVRIAYPDGFAPTSWKVANHYYPTSKEIALEICKMMNRTVKINAILEEILTQKMKKQLDQPDSSFTGPF